MGELERRYARVREALGRDGLDAALVCGTEYTGFEGQVTYLSGFQIVHRYAYVLLPLESDPTIVFPSEARYVGVHGTSWIEDQVFADHPGAWLADRVLGSERVLFYSAIIIMCGHIALALLPGVVGLAIGLVLVGGRPSEVGEHAVAHELGDVALVTQDLARDCVLVGAQELARLLGVETCGERRRADQVDEHHRELPPFGPDRRLRRFGRGGRGWGGVSP